MHKLQRHIMGSWNKTCGLSNLHITSGTPVYVFALEENTDAADRCYATSFWRPVLLPFMSIYDSYGGGEESSGPWLDLIMQGITKELIKQEVGENEFHDIAVKKADFGSDLFFSAVHEHRLFKSVYRRINGAPERVNVAIDFVMMRKDVVDTVLETRVVEQYIGGGKGNTGYCNNYLSYKFSDILADLPEFVDKISSDDVSISRGFSHAYEYAHPNKVAKLLRIDGWQFSKIVDVDGATQKLIRDGNRPAAELLLIEYLKGLYINDFMENTRKLWIPTGHEGSQSNESQDYRILIDAMTAALNAEQAEYDAYMREENLDE